MTNEFYIGKRLSFDGQLCTVRYYGEVKGTKGEWLGVEWDNPTRGKHSGENGGIRYFECTCLLPRSSFRFIDFAGLSKHPTAGSFVRPTRNSDPPRSFVGALKAKYASEDFEDPDVEIVFVGSERRPVKKSQPIRFSGKEAEEVGFDKIRKQLANLHELRIVILDGLCMSRPIARLRERKNTDDACVWPDNLTDIKDACPKTIELDLSRNLFEEWREVASICEQLDRLLSLRVDGTRFRDSTITENEKKRFLKVFANIKTLKLEDTLLSWEELANITSTFYQLNSLVASNNAYSSLTSHYLTPTITDLTLEDNSFSSLSNLQPLTKLPNLQRLVLKLNKISEVTSPGATLPIFSPTVTEVDLSYNEISTWSFIDKLEAVFPGLLSLRISHNPLYSSLQAADGRALTAEDGYMLTLARLGNLKILNYSPIVEKERLNAESYYLSLIARELNFSPPQLQTQILASHPRYKWLCEEYGEPIVNRTENKINPNSLAARLIKFTFYLNDSIDAAITREQPSSPQRFEKEIPMSFTAYTLLGIVSKNFGIPPAKLRLIWETGDWMHAPRPAGTLGEESDSESSDGDTDENSDGKGERVMREVEIVPGTKAIGNWIDGMEAIIRVQLQ